MTVNDGVSKNLALASSWKSVLLKSLVSKSSSSSYSSPLTCPPPPSPLRQEMGHQELSFLTMAYYLRCLCVCERLQPVFVVGASCSRNLGIWLKRLVWTTPFCSITHTHTRPINLDLAPNDVTGEMPSIDKFTHCLTFCPGACMGLFTLKFNVWMCSFCKQMSISAKMKTTWRTLGQQLS